MGVLKSLADAVHIRPGYQSAFIANGIGVIGEGEIDHHPVAGRGSEFELITTGLNGGSGLRDQADLVTNFFQRIQPDQPIFNFAGHEKWTVEI